MKFRVSIVLSVALMCLACAATADAQGRGGGNRFGGNQRSRLNLLRIEAVQKELALTAEQIEQIDKLREELRPQRRPNANQTNAAPDGTFFVQDTPRRQLTEEQRAELRKQAAERAQKEREGLAKILKPEQSKRLTEIFIQVDRSGALRDDEVAKALGITDEQKAQFTKIDQESAASMRELFAGGGGDREAIRAKLTEAQKTRDEKLTAVLTAEQKTKLEEMAGKKFDLPEDAFRPRGRQRSNDT